jgi:hypothetical protein
MPSHREPAHSRVLSFSNSQFTQQTARNQIKPYALASENFQDDIRRIKDFRRDSSSPLRQIPSIASALSQRKNGL